jgi:hypothetical protein
MRFRWYSPEIKRFINQDAHFGDVTIPGTLNRFAYAGNNPISRVDPTGECWVCLGAAIGAIVGVASQAVGDFLDDGKLNDPWEEYAGAAIGGAVTGAIITACPTCGALAGAAGAAAKYISTQGLQGKPVDPVDLALNTTIGAIVGAGPGKGFTRPANFRFATNGIGELVKRQASHQLKHAAIAALKGGVVNVVKKQFGLNALVKREGASLIGDVSTHLTNLFAAPIHTNVEVVARPVIVESSRQNVNRRRKGVYGEYIHYQVWLDAMLLAGRPLPNNPNNVLTSF